MRLFIQDEVTARLVAQLATIRGLSKQASVRMVVQAELDPVTERVRCRSWPPCAPPARCRRAPVPSPTRRSSTSCPTACHDLHRRLGDVRAPEFQLATDPCDRFGKGRHPTGLNMGDCFAYAAARANSATLLCRGAGFAKTDLTRG